MAPGDGKRLRVRSIRVQNASPAGPVNIGFCDTPDALVLCVTPLTANLDVYGACQWRELV